MVQLSATAVEVNWWFMTIQLLGGLALFLLGMTQMTEGLKSAAGHKLVQFLAGMTRNRWSSLSAGTVITTIIQSSSVTTVLVVGFVSAGLMSFPKTLGILLGANIGTTITAQIIAFKVTKAAFLLVAVGYLAYVGLNKNKHKAIGQVVMGLGLVFLGMNVMTEATYPLRAYPPFFDLMQNLTNPLWGIAFGALFTALVQSSSATTGLVIILAGQGLIQLEAGISIIIGANIGTCVTALLAAIGKPRTAVRVAVAHIIFKTLGAALWVGLIHQLGILVGFISGDNVARQIANAHTVFNVVNAFLFIGFTGPIARLIEKLVPSDSSAEKAIENLDPYYLEHPSLALDLVEKAIVDMSNTVIELADKGFGIVTRGDAEALEKLRQRDKEIDINHRRILSYIGQITQASLNESESLLTRKLSEVATLLETLGDIITTDLVEASEHRVIEKFAISSETYQKLNVLYQQSAKALKWSIEAYQTKDPARAKLVRTMKDEFKDEQVKLHDHLYERLSHSEEQRVAIIRYELELLEASGRIFVFARRLAKLVISFSNK